MLELTYTGIFFEIITSLTVTRQELELRFRVVQLWVGGGTIKY